jgi:hypothetical protein
MKRSFAFIILACFLLSSCNSATATPTVEKFTVQYTAASVPWLAGLYSCASTKVIEADQRAADLIDVQSADMAIRIGQPDKLTFPAYQIGNDDLLVITNPQNPVGKLSSEQVRGLFSGQIQNWQEVNGTDGQVQVWAFSSGEDVEQLFEQITLEGSPITSIARLATGPDEMSQAIANDKNAIGILTRHWKAGNVAEVFTVASLPVLALTPEKPKEEIKELIACLQK